MPYTLFESRQRAYDLIEQAKRIWEDSNHSDQLAGLGDDPVFKMLFAALAYQSSLLESEISRMKADVLSEFADYLTPHKGLNPLPATMVIETNPTDNIAEVKIDENVVFSLGESVASFAPVLRTKVINIQNIEVVRMDGRRWRVRFKFNEPILNLEGFSFAINNCDFKSLQIAINGRPLKLIRPWQFSELPFTSFFSIDTVLYNRRFTFDPTSIGMDIFARQNVCIFVASDFDISANNPYGVDTVDMIFEFSGISVDFAFDKSRISLNTILLANVMRQSRTIDSRTPIVKLADDRSSNDPEYKSRYFLHLLPVESNQKSIEDEIFIRTYNAERFNTKGLLDLVNVLLAKIDTDRAAFAAYTKRRSDEALTVMRTILQEIRDVTNDADNNQHFSGVYATLRDGRRLQKTNESIEISYLTSLGAGVNSMLSRNSSLILPSGLKPAATRQIVEPSRGFDPENTPDQLLKLSKYLLITNDRLVTPSDIKAFCLMMLQVRYGLDRKLIHTVNVGHRPCGADKLMGYEIVVDVAIANTPYVKKALEPNLPPIENMIEKLIQVRSSNIYPVRVNIMIDKDNQTERRQ